MIGDTIRDGIDLRPLRPHLVTRPSYFAPHQRPAGHPWCHTQEVRHLSVTLTKEAFQHWAPDAAALITLADWQEGACAMCGRGLHGVAPVQLVKDHDHETDLVRGLLCGSCNVREAYPKNHSSAIEDAPDGDLTVRRYLRMPPTRMLGLTIHYSRTRTVNPNTAVEDWYRQDYERFKRAQAEYLAARRAEDACMT